MEELKKQLETTGFPVAYRSWPEEEAPPLPFICYFCAYSNNFSGDSGVYYKINHVQVELYVKLKDPEAEDKVEQALSSFFWEKTETFLETENCYQIIYEIEVF